MPETVFISYNKADKATALDIATFVTVDDIKVWYDEWEISAGDSIVERINSGLTDCSHFLVVWSVNAATSNWVRRELAAALSRGIDSGVPKVIPIVLDQTVLPPLLADIRHIRYQNDLDADRRNILHSIDGRVPSLGFIPALVRKYHEIIRDQNASREDPFQGLRYCPRCGSSRLEGNTYNDYEGDEVYYSLRCRACEWSDWTE